MDIPSKAASLRSRCKILYRSWWTAHYTIGLIGILSAALLTAASAEMGRSIETVQSTPTAILIEKDAILSLSLIRPNTWLLGVVATICGSLITLLGPLQKAEKYWSAFHLLDQAIMELELDLITINEFASRVSNARKVLQFNETINELAGSDKKNYRQYNNITQQA